MADWWIGEVATDPTYRDEIVPFAVEIVGTVRGVLVDLGCGEGQVLRALDARWAVGCDISEELLTEARDAAAVVRCRLPSLGWLRDGVADAVSCVLVLEHIEDFEEVFAEVARVLRPGGVFGLVMNHPAYTPDGAGPVVDANDGEVLWRWGSYFDRGAGTEPAGPASVVFHHRPLGDLLTAAALAGLVLERLDERGLSPEAVARDPGYAGQEHLPRLLGARWRVPGGNLT